MKRALTVTDSDAQAVIDLLRKAIGFAEIARNLAPGWTQHPDDIGVNQRRIHGRAEEFIERVEEFVRQIEQEL